MTETRTAKEILHDLYGIDAELALLYGEFDDNYLAVAQNGEKTVLKIMHAGCPVERVDLQYQALSHLAETASELNLPRAISTMGSKPYATASVNGVERLVWLLRFCEGTLLEDVTARPDTLIRSFGRTLALLDVGLRTFTHPAMRPGHEWELTRAAKARVHLPHVSDAAQRLVETVLRRFERDTLGTLGELPHSVIHNDANDGNVLVNINDAGVAEVDGLIDFGDISYQPTVCDAAIALSYVVINKDDPLSTCAVFLEGYNKINPLSEKELAVLLEMMMLRLAVSIAITAGRRSKDPDDPIGSQDKEPAIRALKHLAGISRQKALRRFRRACEVN